MPKDINNIYTKLKSQLEDLPGEKAHLEMIPFRKSSRLTLEKSSEYRTSAVLIIIFKKEGKHYSILTERQDYNGKHSGQISFPGGKKEDSDRSTLETSLRETYEEIGLKIDSKRVIGQLSQVHIPVSKFLVFPFVAFLEEQPRMQKDNREVKNIVQFPVSELLNPENRISTKINIPDSLAMKNVPCFKIQDKIVWGATALMLNELRIILERTKISF